MPRLTACGTTSAGDSFTIELEGVAPTSTALFLLGVFEASIPAAGPCSLLVTPVLPCLVSRHRIDYPRW